VNRTVSHDSIDGKSHTSSNSGTSSSTVRVLIVERNRMSGQLLADLLARHEKFQTSFASRSDAVAVAHQISPHVAVVSAHLQLSADGGNELTRSLSEEFPGMGVLVLLDEVQRDAIVEVFRCGARGVFCRTESVDDLVRGIESVGRGQIWAGKAESECLLDALRNVPSPTFRQQNGIQNLTRRELQAVQYAAQGYTNRAIAEQLHLSGHTVKNYLFRAFEKLGVSSRIELLFYLMVKGRTLEAEDSDSPSKASNMESVHKAALHGFPVAQFFLALAYRDGQECTPNALEAYIWLSLAQHNASELCALAQTFAAEIQGRLDPDEAESAEERIAKLKSTIKSAIYDRGHGLQQDNYEWRIKKIPA
jgi:two-component system nitrate/nitrite response regulator NarL